MSMRFPNFYSIFVLVLLFATLTTCSNGRAAATVLAWGYYYDLTMPETYRPMYVPAGLTNVVAVSGGYNHAVALKSDGTVAAWGWDNTVTNVPAGLSNVVSVAAGYDFTLALKKDGLVVGWGYSPGQAHIIPATLSNVVSIAAGFWHALALKSDGTVAAWGSNLNGSAWVPAGLNHVVAVAASWQSDFSSLALKDDGTVVAWGTSPSWTNVVAIACGGDRMWRRFLSGPFGRYNGRCLGTRFGHECSARLK